MAYPADKETFRRVVNQELPAIPGDVVMEGDQNNMGDFVERLQDTFGYDIKMGYASVKAFFSDLITKSEGLRKIRIEKLFQADIGDVKTSGQWGEYGTQLNLLATDIVFFQSILNWYQQGNSTAQVLMKYQRGTSPFSPSNIAFGVGENQRTNSPMQFFYFPPTAGSANFYIRIEQQVANGYWDRLSFVAIIISI